MSGAARALQTGGEVRGLADHRALLRRSAAQQIADDNETGRDADAAGEPNARARVQRRDRGDEIEAGHDGALGVVLARLRIAEIDQHAVAHVFRDKAANAGDRRRDNAMIGADDLTQILGIELRRERGRADQIAEHHRQLPPLGVAPRCECCGRFGRRSRCIGHGRGSAQGGDGIEQPAAVADRGDAQLAQILGGQLPQDRIVDVIIEKSLGILCEPQPVQPIDDRGRHCRGIPSAVEAPLPRVIVRGYA